MIIECLTEKKTISYIFIKPIEMMRIIDTTKYKTMGVMVGDTLCVFCGKEEESTSHILVSCKVSIKVWNVF